MDQEQTRFRSFAERYVIERASGFKSDTDAWTAVQDAMRIYKMIEQQSARVSRQLEPAEDTQQAGAGQMLQTSPWAAPPSPLNPAPGSPGSPGWAQANHNMMVHQAMQALATSPPILSPAAKTSRIRQIFNWTRTP